MIPQRKGFVIASGVVGGALLGLAGLWLAWLLLHQFAGSTIPAPPVIGNFPLNPPVAQITPLVAEGITLNRPSQAPTLSQQQALFIASQLEPGAASKAKTPTAEYVLLNYPGKGTAVGHPDYHDVPAWMISTRAFHCNLPTHQSILLQCRVRPTISMFS